MEQHLKLIVRSRKNANYFKTAAGAAIGDVITSIISSASVNVLESLNAIQSHQDAVKANPRQWLPWNYPRDDAA